MVRDVSELHQSVERRPFVWMIGLHLTLYFFAQLELFLRLFGEDLYKTLNSQEAFNDYQKSFVPTFTP